MTTEDNIKPPTNRRIARWPMCLTGLVMALMVTTGADAASSSALTWSEDHKLDFWLERELAPYLAETLSQHPRFKNVPVRFVAMEGETIREDMDDLTRDIIHRLRNTLQKAQGIHLVWQPDKFAQLPCHKINRPEYHIGIEITALGKHRYRIGVRALDVQERSWVTGFGREWQGTLSRAQRIALGRRDGGGELLGLRDYPYSEAQADLLAQDLAQMLSRRFCGFVGEPLVVYPRHDGDAPVIVSKTLNLVGHYLSRSQEVTVTGDPAEANIILSARAVGIDKGLHQFWVMVRPAERDPALPELDTHAYVRLSAPTRAVVASRATANRPDAPVVQRPTGNRLLSAVTVITPQDPRNCRSTNPWRFSNGIPSANNVVPADGCFALEMHANRDARLFLLDVDDVAGVVRLLPSACNRFGRVRTTVERGETLRFPARRKGTYHAFNGPGYPASETFFAIAVSDRRAADRIDDHVAKLVDACNARRGETPDRPSVDAWFDDLRNTIDELGERAEWQRVHVRYLARRDTLASRD